MTVSILRTAVGVVDVAAVAMSVVYGLTRVGSPSDERERRLDERRVEDLRGGIARAVDLHWTRRGSLPASLHELSDATVRDVALNDPGARGALRVSSPGGLGVRALRVLRDRLVRPVNGSVLDSPDGAA